MVDSEGGFLRNVEVAVTFEEPVTVDTEAGTPALRACRHRQLRDPLYASGTGTDTLTFSIAREDGAAPAPTVIVEGDSLALNGGAIESTTGLVAEIGHQGAALAGFPGPELPSIGASDAEALEFRLELSQESETPVSVDYETADGTALGGADYVPLSGTVSFAPGETVKTIAVAMLSDGDAEPAETLTLRLSNAEGATLGTSEASGGADTFTGTFSAVPPEHDGTNGFELTLTFDEEPEGLSYKTVHQDLFTTAGGTIENARRASPPSNRAYTRILVGWSLASGDFTVVSTCTDSVIWAALPCSAAALGCRIRPFLRCERELVRVPTLYRRQPNAESDSDAVVGDGDGQVGEQGLREQAPGQEAGAGKERNDAGHEEEGSQVRVGKVEDFEIGHF